MPAVSRRPAKAASRPLAIESKRFGKDRAAFEAALQAALDRHQVELICLGGFMRLLTAEFVQRWYGRMLNIHPSLLPSFPGLEPQAQALRAGVKISGATVHFVTPETDAGPIVMQGAVAVRDDDTPDTLAARILTVEHRIYPDALRLLAGALSGWRAISARRRRPDPRRRVDFAGARLGLDVVSLPWLEEYGQYRRQGQYGRSREENHDGQDLRQLHGLLRRLAANRSAWA